MLNSSKLWITAFVFALIALTNLLAPRADASGPRSDFGHAAELRKALGFDASNSVVERAAFDEERFPDMTMGDSA